MNPGILDTAIELAKDANMAADGRGFGGMALACNARIVEK